jgi:hypothetical protein
MVYGCIRAQGEDWAHGLLDQAAPEGWKGFAHKGAPDQKLGILTSNVDTPSIAPRRTASLRPVTHRNSTKS